MSAWLSFSRLTDEEEDELELEVLLIEEDDEDEEGVDEVEAGFEPI